LGIQWDHAQLLVTLEHVKPPLFLGAAPLRGLGILETHAILCQGRVDKLSCGLKIGSFPDVGSLRGERLGPKLGE
jgi:hypothetical protein